MPVRENRDQVLRQMVLPIRGMFPGWKNRDGTGLIFRLMQRLGKPFFQFVGGELLSLAENLPLAIPDDPIPTYCLPYFHGRQARSTEFAAAKPLDLQSVVRAPNAGQRIVEDCRYNFTLRGWRNTPLFNGNRRQCGDRERESPRVS